MSLMEASRQLWEARSRLRTGMRRAHARLSAAHGAVEAASVEWILGLAHSRHQHLAALGKLESKWKASLAASMECYEEWKAAVESEAEQLKETKQVFTFFFCIGTSFAQTFFFFFFAA